MPEVKINNLKNVKKSRLLDGGIILCLAVWGLTATGCLSSTPEVILAEAGKAKTIIVLPLSPSVTQRFAADELAKYLRQISGATFVIDSGTTEVSSAIRLMASSELAKEAYEISIQNHDIILAAGSGRAMLYAAYDLLSRLGCRWIAPQFSFYQGYGEYVPRKPELSFLLSHPILQKPQFAFRKLDIEEGRSHNIENLKQIIDWMPKLGFNIFMVPLDYGGYGRVQWDNWRAVLTPELKKRGLMIEVGGHGYQNFLNADMPATGAAGEAGQTLFSQHPEWFGRDKNCHPSPAESLVFNTADPDAVQYLMDQVLAYLRQHPEIDIFDFWPPDMARWAECPELLSLGSFQDRQARLVNQVDSAIKTVRPDLQLEMIAYARALLPPAKVPLNKDILVDFCPINQNYEKQIYDSTTVNNEEYADAICAWRKQFPGDIGLYSYYRKYAWRSLPNVIPHYIQRDMQWYAGVPLQGISIYSEPGDWGTYELNYYALGRLAWNPDCNIDSLIDQFVHARYGSAWEIADSAYASLENIVRNECSIPHSSRKSAGRIREAEKELSAHITEVRSALQHTRQTDIQAALSRLLLMLQYAAYDLDIQHALAVESSPETTVGKIDSMVTFLEQNSDRGVFLLSAEDNLRRYGRHYGIPDIGKYVPFKN